MQRKQQQEEGDENKDMIVGIVEGDEQALFSCSRRLRRRAGRRCSR